MRKSLQCELGSQVMFESYARIFLTKLILKYDLQPEDYEFSKSFTAQYYKQVLDDLAARADLSPSHFFHLFKQTIGQSLYQFLMTYRIEQAKKMLDQPNVLMAEYCFFLWLFRSGLFLPRV